MSKNILAFSGGKDSTSLALRLAELGEDFTCLFTPTGNELPELFAHIRNVLDIIKRPLVTPENKPLTFWMKEFNALPNNRQRWCTRLIKIVPAIAYLEAHPGSTLIVGLRADEEERKGLFGDYCTYRYPLREWGWGIKEVLDYCDARGVKVPKRTDCAFCYDQRLYEWHRLWREQPALWTEGERWEADTNHTFRSPSRDTWPAAMKDLRGEFERGRVPRGVRLTIFGEQYEDDESQTRCRVCRM